MSDSSSSSLGSSSRRAFLKSSAGCLGGAFALCALLPESLSALPVAFAEGTGAGAERAYPLPATDSVTVDAKAGMILTRTEGKVHAFSLACPHERAAVKWVPKENRFSCTKHDSKYRPDGTYISGRATRGLDRFPIRREGDSVFVNLDLVFRLDKDPDGWQKAEIAL
jgi:Rieske Fe-S protein